MRCETPEHAIEAAETRFRAVSVVFLNRLVTDFTALTQEVKDQRDHSQELLGLFVVNFLSYGFFATHLMVNHDGVNDFPNVPDIHDYEMYISGGRFTRAFLKWLFGGYPTPFLEGMVAIIGLSVCGYFVARTLHIKGGVATVVCGSLYSTFPFIANTFAYLDWYPVTGPAFALCAFSIWAMTRNNLFLRLCSIPAFVFCGRCVPILRWLLRACSGRALHHFPSSNGVLSGRAQAHALGRDPFHDRVVLPMLQ